METLHFHPRSCSQIYVLVCCLFCFVAAADDDEVDEEPEFEPEPEPEPEVEPVADAADGAGEVGAAEAGTSSPKKKARKKPDPRLRGLTKDQKAALGKIQNEDAARAVRQNQLMPYTMDDDWEFVVAVKPRESTVAVRKARGKNAAKNNDDSAAAENEEDMQSQETENDWKEPWVNAFVNHVHTTKGGTHVDLVTKTISIALANVLREKYKKLKDQITPALIRQHMWLFVNALIPNPDFDTQTKETMTLPADKFGGESNPNWKLNIDEKYIKKLATSALARRVLRAIDEKQNAALRNVSGSNAMTKTITGLKKLEDANWAGGEYREDTTIIFTEGDSAKALAVAGISVVGRDRYGVFPLQGKVVNPSGKSAAKVLDNKEVKAIMKILGIKGIGQVFTERKQLRYGHVMLMADQDFDGSHIKGDYTHQTQQFVMNNDTVVKQCGKSKTEDTS